MNKAIEYETVIKTMQEMELGHTLTLVSPSGVRTFTLTSVEPLGKNIMGCGSKPPFTVTDELDTDGFDEQMREFAEHAGIKPGWTMDSTPIKPNTLFTE